MNKTLSHCGINCGECPAYLATQKNNIEEIKKIPIVNNQKIRSCE